MPALFSRVCRSFGTSRIDNQIVDRKFFGKVYAYSYAEVKVDVLICGILQSGTMPRKR